MRQVATGVTVLLVLVLAGGLAGTASAEVTEIDNWTELQEMQSDLDGDYILTSDLDETTGDYDVVAGETANAGAGFIPVGNESNEFTGTFDGNSHTILGLYINRTVAGFDLNQVGLFGATNGTTVSNLTLASPHVVGENDVGAIVGVMTNSSVTDVEVTDAYVRARFAERGGGVAGSMIDSDITSASTDGAVDGSGIVIGGIVGAMDGSSVADSTSSADITGGYRLGGAVGLMFDSTIVDTHASGRVTGMSDFEGKPIASEEIGGLVGFNRGGSIVDSSASGDVSGDVVVGGLVGQHGQQMYLAVDAPGSSLTNATASGNVTGAEAVGGLIGLSVDATVSDSSASGDVTGATVVGGLIGDATEMQEPILLGTQGIASAGISDSTATGNVTATGAIKGESTEAFAGGLIGLLQGTDVQSTAAHGAVTLAVDGNNSTTAAGGLIGAVRGGMVSDSAATGAVTATVTAETVIAEATGGLLGQSLDATVTRSSATGAVSASELANVGGLIGYNNGTSVEMDDPVGPRSTGSQTVLESFATGSVVGGDNVGGLIGQNVNDVVTDSYATGAVSGDDGVGGLVGLHSGQNATVERSYAVGAVDATDSAGGLVGVSETNATVADAYWDRNTTGQDSSAGGAVGLTTAEMKGNGAENTMFSFDGTWTVVQEGQDGVLSVSYPYLQDNEQSPAPGLESMTLLSIADQGVASNADDIVVETVDSLGQEAAIIVTYENEGTLTVAGLETGTFDNESVTLELEDLGGFAGDHTAHIVPTADLSGTYGAGDTVSTTTAEAILTQQEAYLSVDIQGNLAADTTGDGRLDDLTGDGFLDITDVQVLFENLDDPALQRHAGLFDFSGTGLDRVSVFDVQALFTQYQAQQAG